MALEAVPTSQADSLIAMAEALEEQAAEALATHDQLMSDAYDFRRRAELVRIRAARDARAVVTLRPRNGATIPLRDLQVVKQTIARLQPTSPRAIAQALNITLQMARTRMLKLEELGEITRTGRQTSTQWWVKGEEVHGPGTKEVIRDIAIELGALDLSDIVECGYSLPTARRYMDELVEEGKFERDEVEDETLPVAKRVIYGYIEPEAKAVNRPKVPTPEAVAVASFAKASRGLAVAGTGKGINIRNAEVGKLIEDVKAQGCTLRQIGGSHIQFLKDGVPVGGVSNGNVDHRALENQRSELRRKGIDV